MSWEAFELDRFATQDVDDIVERAGSLSSDDRANAFRDVLDRLPGAAEPLDRLKLFLFLQTMLAFQPDGTLSRELTNRIANELSTTVTSESGSDELRRSALTSLALLGLKAEESSPAVDARIDGALTAARHSSDPEISGFAQRIFARRRSATRTGNRPKVFIIHGRDEENTLRLEKFVRDHWRVTVVTLSDSPSRGRSTIERFEDAVRDAVFALAVLTPHDFVDSRIHASWRSDVVFELGLALGRLGRSRVCVLFKKDSDVPSDLEGIRRIDFSENVLDVTRQVDAAVKQLDFAAEIDA